MSALRVFGGRLASVIVAAVEESVSVVAASSCDVDRGGGGSKMGVSGSMLGGSVRRRGRRVRGRVRGRVRTVAVAVGVDELLLPVA